MTVIQVDNLSKTFKVPQREGGLAAALGSVFVRKYKHVEAVKGVSFGIEPGEIVGFLGPNGAGKTTTLKMLAGLLHPTAGSASVLGYTPWQRDSDYLRRISMVMGQRSQLNWDLPPIDSFHVHLAVYQIDKVKGRQRLDELIELLDLENVLRKQVRSLSLGERMKCEICVSLLHQPDVLFLDEPTLGVDITMQARIREFVAEYNRRYNATIILTSHYMADVTALCKRLVVIDYGQILYDGPLVDLAARLAPFKVIQIELTQDVDGYDFERLGHVLHQEHHKVTLRIDKAEAANVTTHLLADLPVLDLTIEDPPIEDIIRNVFDRGRENVS
jgi:ABC-2 type transport system ATP-binding protein